MPSNYPPGVTGNEEQINPTDRLPVEYVTGEFLMADGTRIKFMVLADGTVRRWSRDLTYGEFTGSAYSITQDAAEALRDGLIEQQGAAE